MDARDKRGMTVERLCPRAHHTLGVMAGLVPAIHVFYLRNAAKTWMPGIKPGMTVERLCACTCHIHGVMAGLVIASRIYPTCDSFYAEVGQARLPVPSTSLLKNPR